MAFFDWKKIKAWGYLCCACTLQNTKRRKYGNYEQEVIFCTAIQMLSTEVCIYMHIHVHTMHALYAHTAYSHEILLNIFNSGSMLHIYSHILQCEQPLQSAHLQWHLMAFALLLGSSSPRYVPQLNLYSWGSCRERPTYQACSSQDIQGWVLGSVPA